jgi:hypothetical protein
VIKAKIDKTEFKNKREEQIERLKQLKNVISLSEVANVKLFEVNAQGRQVGNESVTTNGSQVEQEVQMPDRANVLVQTAKM